MDFVRDFLNYVEKEGVYDHFDRDSQKMVTSPGVQVLIKDARSYLPPKLKGKQAATLMRDLPDEMREKLIEKSDRERVVDLRTAFARKQAENGGARGVLERLVASVNEGFDQEEFEKILRDAKGLVAGPETVYNSAEEVNESTDAPEQTTVTT
jgi:hypothetical protein